MEEDGGVKAPLTRLRRRLSVEQPDDTKSPSAPSTPTKKRGRLAAKPQLELIDENAAQSSPKRSTRKSIAREIIETTEEKPGTPARRTTRTKSNTSIVSETGPMEDKPGTPAKRTANIKSNTSIISETGPTEDKPVTPARRNTRTKSNTSITSIVSETAQTFDSPRAKRAARRTSQVGSDNEAPVTPARIRRTRKDSTSSIDKQVTPVSDTAVTPGRTRRTRRDSASSLDNAAGSISDDRPALITEVISEEPEANDRKSITSSGTSGDLKDEIRKSPRIMEKKNRKDNSSRSDIESNNNDSQNNNEPVTLNKSVKTDTGNDLNSKKTSNSLSSEYDQNESNHATESGSLEKDKLSISSTNLIKDMNTVPKKKTSIINKSSSDVEELQKPKNKRNRTKSWTTLSVTPSSEGHFFSDNESTKRNLKQYQKLAMKNLSNKAGCGDGLLNVSKTDNKSDSGDINDILLHSSMKRKKKHSERSFTGDEKSNKESFISEKSSSNIPQVEKTPHIENVSNESIKEEKTKNKEDLLDMNSKNNDTAASELLFDKAPSGAIKTILYLDDSDTDSIGKSKIEKKIQGDDQCVPVVNHHMEKSPENPNLITLKDLKDNDSCEPMDIDDTIPDNVTLNDSSKENRCKNDSYKSERENVSDIPQEVKNYVNEGLYTSDKNSSISHSISHEFEYSENEKKSTLILSQIKEASTENNVTKSSLVSSNKLLSKSINIPEVTINGNENKTTPFGSNNEIVSKSIHISAVGKNEIVKQNVSQNYLTSTPVHQKHIKKLDLPMNTSLIAPDNKNQKETLVNDTVSESKMKITNSTLGSEDSDSSDLSDEEQSMQSRGILDDEADDAGDDYESGDSQDEEDRQYVRDHEILDKGETLTSDDEISNDSEYEKDSFLVSSDEEDNELLSGSEDDLSLSDNELTFSAKSKKKYDDRKQKEQKKASKEMFEARHKLNEKSSKSEEPKPQKKNRLRLDSTLLESGDDVAAPPKKNKRLRLESSQDSSMGDSTSEAAVFEKQDGIVRKKKKKSKRLSDYSCSESAIIENEITAVCDKSAIDKDDPLLMLVKQELKTPDREDIERVQVDENMSLVKPNESFDPLQATIAQEDESESISENEEITKNYDSILNELNKEIKPKQKVCDISLNLNKKTKQKTNEPIVEELNLTQTKMTKTKKKSRDIDSDLDKNKEMSVKTVFKKLIGNHDEESSDSINLRLLFSDDSNDEGKGDNGKKEMSGEIESFIPLKKSEGKTNIRGNMNANENDHNESLVNTSSKKKDKKRKSSQNDEIKSTKVVEEENVNFFFDTTGTRLDFDTSTNTSLNTSLKKKKNKKNSISIANDLERSENREVATDVNCDDAPTEVSFISEKHKDKTNKTSANSEDTTGKSVNVSLSKTPNSDKKKKKKKSVSRDGEKQEAPINVNSDNVPTEVSLISEKHKKKTTVSENNKESTEKLVDVSFSKTPNSEKKKKKKLESQDEEKPENYKSAFLSYREMSESAKKKKQKNSAVEILDAENTPQDIEGEYKAEAIEERTAKKRKRKSSANHTDETQPKETTPLLQASESFNKCLPNASQQKKRKVSLSEDSCVLNNGLHAASHKGSVQLTNEKLEHLKLNKAEKRKKIQNDSDVQKQTDTKKRKKKEEDDGGKRSKIPKENSLDKIHVSRLPSTFINQLEDKSRKEDLEMRKLNVVSTSEFKVEESKRRQKIQPSTFLEESIYLNTDSESPVVKKQKANIKKPKVLPFIPTATTSYSGFTTNFQVNVIPQKMEFVAQRTDETNFRNDYLRNNKLKKLRTYELYKQHRNIKLSKF